MSLTLVGLLSSRADPDCHNVSSSLQVWCSYLLLSIVLIMQQLAVCKVRPVRAPPRQYGLSYWPWPPSQAGLVSYLEWSAPRHQHIAARHRTIIMTGRARIPAHMVQLIANARHFEAVNNLRISRAIRVYIYRGEVIRFLDARARINRDGVKQLFMRGFNRSSRT